MADQTSLSMTQREDTPKPNSQKFQHMKTVSSLADGHRYALQYFPEELQALLNIASLKLDERVPGHFGAILGWQKDSGEKSEHPRVTMKPLEVLWDLEHRTIVLSDSFPFSRSTWKIVDINGEEALPVLRRDYDLVPPFSTILTVVDQEHLVLLEVFFRYSLLVQGFDDAIEGFKNEFWLCFEKLCRHVAEQTSAANAQEKEDEAYSSEKAAPSTPAQTQDTKLDSLTSEADTSEHVHQESSTAPETKGEQAEATGDHIEEQLAKAHKEAAGWKKAYEGEKNFSAKLRFVLRKHVARNDELKAKLKEREGEVQEWKEKCEALCKERRET
ncbi:uncharacterized protein J4E84_009367 [Alternaria hordeiaustralica]|uniref:uncharacterized protein n=1 Tax=Alternaria hordeiaustralica TaxID=1187925 RepID=UPI0020C52F49|nr:uncharacterized protein J4E84_009367 [Alternaria hordeiaustralica]KAI4676773.1 hypothetical protein J4E84_009367 [Alternaria hordeiaustralica]